VEFQISINVATPKFTISTLFTLKCPPQNQHNTRVCHIIGSLVFWSNFLFHILLFNPTSVNEKATDIMMSYIIV